MFVDGLILLCLATLLLDDMRTRLFLPALASVVAVGLLLFGAGQLVLQFGTYTLWEAMLK